MPHRRQVAVHYNDNDGVVVENTKHKRLLKEYLTSLPIFTTIKIATYSYYISKVNKTKTYVTKNPGI